MPESHDCVLLPCDVMRLLGVCRDTVDDWGEKGKLRYVRLPSRHRRFSIGDTMRAVRERKESLEQEAARLAVVLGERQPARKRKSECS